MLARVSDRPTRPFALLLQDVITFLRALWQRFAARPDAAKDASIDWEDGEAR